MKLFKNREELINYLQNERHICIDSKVNDYLNEYRFASLYSPYKDLFATSNPHGTRIFSDNLQIKDFVGIVNLDIYFSIYLNLSIGNLERRIKSFLTDIICASMKENGDITCTNYDFLEEMKDGVTSTLNCFNTLLIDHKANGDVLLLSADGKIFNLRIKTIEKIQEILNNIQESKVNYYLKDYAKTHTEIPFWVLVGSLSFGDLVNLFGMLKTNYKKEFLQKALCREEPIHDDEIYSFSNELSTLTTIRNIVHHHEPIIPFLISPAYNRYLDVRLNAFKKVISIYKQSLFTVFDQPKPVLNIEIYGANKKYVERLKKYYNFL